MDVLLTGATGLLGVEVIDALSTTCDITALSRRGLSTEHDRLHVVPYDLSQPLDVSVLPKKTDVIIHLAQSPHYREFPDNASDVLRINTMLTQSLLEYGVSAGAKQFIYASSGSVYAPYTMPIEESQVLFPQGFYATSKYASELIMHNYADYIDTCAMRLFFLYGPHPEAKSTLVNALINRVKNDQPITVEGKEQQGLIFSPTLTTDVAHCINLALNGQWKGVLNVANPEWVSIKQLATQIGQLLEKPVSFEYLTDKEPLIVKPLVDRLLEQCPAFEFTALADGIKQCL